MEKLNDIKEKLNTLQKKYGKEYFIFVAPYDLKKCNDLKIFDYYVINKVHPPDQVLIDINDLDIYFVNNKDIERIRSGKPLPFNRLSNVDLTKL